jgi:hypothetical protein
LAWRVSVAEVCNLHEKHDSKIRRHHETQHASITNKQTKITNMAHHFTIAPPANLRVNTPFGSSTASDSGAPRGLERAGYESTVGSSAKHVRYVYL